jgi:hypothetical protein
MLGNVAVLAEHVNARILIPLVAILSKNKAARIRIIDPWLEHYIAAVF